MIKPRVYWVYYSKLKRHFWRVSRMPLIRTTKVLDLWTYAHNMAREMNNHEGPEDMPLTNDLRYVERRTEEERKLKQRSPTKPGNVRCMDCRCNGEGCPGMPPGYEARLMEDR